MPEKIKHPRIENIGPESEKEPIREPIFDGDVKEAEREAQEVARMIGQSAIGMLRGENAESFFETNGRKIDIVWKEKEGRPAMMLRLTSIDSANDGDNAAPAYDGLYGIAVPATHPAKDGGYDFLDEQKAVSIQELFGVPAGERVAIVPTRLKWSLAESNPSAGDAQSRLYMGLGFLLLGHEWMLVGMHEAGHLSHADENDAWSNALQHYAAIHRPQKRGIIAGENPGLFDLLAESASPRIADIMKYGLVSHAATGKKVRVSSRWMRDQESIMDEFGRVEDAARQQFTDCVEHGSLWA